MSDVAPQRWDPDRYARNARFVADFGAPVAELLAPRPGERVLDLGCGDGPLTLELVQAGAEVVGADGSAEQVAAAKARGLDARVADGQTLEFDAEFDAVFSNAALHWMKDADAVIDGVWRALRPGGRFVAEMGAGENVGSIRSAVHAALRTRAVDPWPLDPWYFPSEAEYRAKLEARGFEVRRMELFARPTPLPGDIDGWLETFAESFLNALGPADRPAFVAEVREALAPRLCDADGAWTADYVRLRFAAHKSG